MKETSSYSSRRQVDSSGQRGGAAEAAEDAAEEGLLDELALVGRQTRVVIRNAERQRGL